MRLLFACTLACRLLCAAQFENQVIQVESVNAGTPQSGTNPFSATVRNKTDKLITLILDLRADPGLWLHKTQYQFVYLLYANEERIIEAHYDFPHLSALGFLRVRLYFPTVGTNGVTEFNRPFFDQHFAVAADNPAIDYDLAKFRTRETRQFSIYYFPDSLAARDIDRIAVQRDAGFEKVSEVLRVHSDLRIRLFLFPDAESKTKDTGHQGAGWAFGNNVVEIYNDSTRLNPYHETAHILATAIGDPAAVFNEGFATYVSELLGSDALADLGSPGLPCGAAVLAHRKAGKYIPLTKLLTFDDIGPEASQPTISYAEACSLVGYLTGKYGLDKFRQAYSSVGPGAAEQMQKIYGVSLAEIERGWLADLESTAGAPATARPASPRD
ncbi:MAG: hypothetical protein ABSE21_02790 [Bryobacteraceae bacterium]|jgi:hypothetical protein